MALTDSPRRTVWVTLDVWGMAWAGTGFPAASWAWGAPGMTSQEPRVRRPARFILLAARSSWVETPYFLAMLPMVSPLFTRWRWAFSAARGLGAQASGPSARAVLSAPEAERATRTVWPGGRVSGRPALSWRSSATGMLALRATLHQVSPAWAT